MYPVSIGHFLIDTLKPALIIAEAGVNHNGELEKAFALIDAAVETGANAIKFQSYVTEELITVQTPKANYQKQTTDASESQYEMLKRLELSPEAQKELAEYCQSKNILFLSTPYDPPSLQTLLEIDVAAIKIGSSDITNIPYLRKLARCGKPVLLSTGMADMNEVKEAVQAFKQENFDDWVLLHCTSEYPAPPEEANLKAIHTLQEAFGHPAGFSDHTPGIGVSPWAVAAGACVIEKHFTLDKSLPGPDHAASLEPVEMAQLVTVIRELESAMGDGVKRVMPSEAANKALVQKSLVARKQINQGETITEAHLACKRPASGLPPREWDRVIGKKAARTIEADQPVTQEVIVWEP